MAAGDMADRVGHSQNRESEGQGHAQGSQAEGQADSSPTEAQIEGLEDGPCETECRREAEGEAFLALCALCALCLSAVILRFACSARLRYERAARLFLSMIATMISTNATSRVT